MARHPTSRRVQRQNTEPDDVFVERVLETSVWAKENAKLLIIAATALVVIVSGFLYYRNYTVRLRSAAETQLSTIRQAVVSGNSALAIRDLEEYMIRFGGTDAGPEAIVLLGRAYLDNNEPQKAIDLLSEPARNLARPLGASTAFLLAGAYEAAIQEDRAVQVYLDIADRAPFDYQKHEALDNAARIRLETGDAGGALELYDRLLLLLEDTDPLRPVIQLRRGEAAARAQGTAGS